MQKPTTDTIETYNLNDITNFVIKKYNLKISYNDIWYWFVTGYEPNNGSVIYLDTEIDLEEDEMWVSELKKYLKIEFGDNIPLMVSW